MSLAKNRSVIFPKRSHYYQYRLLHEIHMHFTPPCTSGGLKHLPCTACATLFCICITLSRKKPHCYLQHLSLCLITLALLSLYHTMSLILQNRTVDIFYAERIKMRLDLPRQRHSTSDRTSRKIHENFIGRYRC